MKKIIASVAMVAMAMAVQANVVNGDMSATAFKYPSTQPIPTSRAIDAGWTVHNGSSMKGGASGVASIRPTSPGRDAGIGQFFTENTLTGNVKLKFDLDYAVTPGAKDVTFGVCLVGYKLTPGPITSSANNMHIGGMNIRTTLEASVTVLYWGGLDNVNLGMKVVKDSLRPPEGYNLIIAHKGSTGQQTASGTYYIDVNIGAAGTYDFYGLMFVSNNSSNDLTNDHIYIDNVALVPEPAMVGMLSHGVQTLRFF